ARAAGARLLRLPRLVARCPLRVVVERGRELDPAAAAQLPARSDERDRADHARLDGRRLHLDLVRRRPGGAGVRARVVALTREVARGGVRDVAGRALTVRPAGSRRAPAPTRRAPPPAAPRRRSPAQAAPGRARRPARRRRRRAPRRAGSRTGAGRETRRSTTPLPAHAPT